MDDVTEEELANMMVGHTVKLVVDKKEANPKDVVFEIGSIMLKLAGFSDDLEYNKSQMQEVINNGKAFEKFERFPGYDPNQYYFGRLFRQCFCGW